MDKKDVEMIASRIGQNSEFSNRSYEKAITRYVEQFLSGNELEIFHIPHDIKIADIASIFGLESLQGKEIVAQYLCNKVSGYTRKYSDSQRIRTPVSVEGMLQRVADLGSGDDYPNDFYAGIAIKLDEQTCIAFLLDQEEEVGVCLSCHAAGYDDVYHGCEHDEPDTYTLKYGFTLCRPERVGSIDWDL